YGDDFYKGMPAVTRNSYGKGHVYYVGTHMEEAGLDNILDKAAAEAEVESVVSGGEGLEIVCRKTKEGKQIYFVMNFGEQERALPACFAGQRDLLTGEKAADTLKKYEVCIIEAEES
ncbi:MAG: beta-galactosidase, partial [Lachnospiraceae bacterium]|nr:beta-galactosidase [Lachnospiraceae bacterium]